MLALALLDMIIVIAAVVGLFLIAAITGRRENDTQDFFLARRRVPSWVACLSFVAAEVSAMTIIAVPAVAYQENWHYLQFFVGSAAARLFVAFLFIPHYFKTQCTSIYEFLYQRFGRAAQVTGSCLFFVTRLLASSVRLYAACAAVAIIMNWPLWTTILAFTVISIIIVVFGGIKAVVWTGAYQAIMFYLGAAVLIFVLVRTLQPGWWTMLVDAGKVQIFDFSLDWHKPTSFWAGSLNAFFVGLAVFGTDQELVQRLLTVKTRQASQRTIIGTIIAAFPITLLYLLVGSLLYAFYQQNAIPIDQAKHILSNFVSNYLAVGPKGLILSVIILASIDSPLASLSSSFVTDIYRPVLPDRSERHYLLISRLGVIGFGIILALLAWACAPVENLLWFAFKIFSITGGAALGIFLLGFISRSRGNWAVASAMILSVVAMAALLILRRLEIISLAWTWFIVLGTAVSSICGWLFCAINTYRHKFPQS